MLEYESDESLRERFGRLADFQIWLERHEPKDTMIWKKSWWERNIFIRDRLLDKLFKSATYKLIGSHYSKSIECPVVLVRYKGAEIVLQYNFYDWQIMVRSPKALKLGMLEENDAKGDYFYYQGIPTEYHFKQYDATNNCKEFAIDISDDLYNAWGIMLELKRAIDGTF